MIEKTKALRATEATLLTIIVLVVLVPAPRNTIAKEAPNAAALDKPRVYGDAKGFFNTDCIITPERARPPPTKIAERTRGIRTSHTIRPRLLGSRRMIVESTSAKGILMLPAVIENTIARSRRRKRRSKKNPFFLRCPW